MRSISTRTKSSAVKKSLVKQGKPLLDTTPTMTESLVKTNFRDGVDHEARWAVLSEDTRKKSIAIGMGVVSRDEVVNNAERMFRKIDDNSDDVITSEELEASRRQ
jgi:hypothetical protein